MSDRVFEYYKRDLEKLGEKHGRVRMICVEYVCKFPGIDPVDMARSLVRNGMEVVFDDSSISTKENDKKKRAVYKEVT